MAVPWPLLLALKPVIEHRLRSYADTAAADAALWANSLRRRLLGTAVAFAACFMCLLLGSAWLVGASWNTPWRSAVLATLLGIFLGSAIIGAAIALWPVKPGRGPFAGLRRQLGGDLMLLSELCTSEGSPLAGHAGALNQLMQGSSASGASGTFPRSTVMRLLLTFTGLARIIL
jgi:hypothetical protein